MKRDEELTKQFLPTSLRAAIVASSFWVLSLPMTVVSGSVAAFCGCLFVCYAIDLRLDSELLHHVVTTQLRWKVFAAF